MRRHRVTTRCPETFSLFYISLSVTPPSSSDKKQTYHRHLHSLHSFPNQTQLCVGSQHLSKDSWSQLQHDGHGPPRCPPRHIPRGPQGSCYCFSPCATCAYYGLNLNQESREALNVTEHIFIGLHFVLLTAVNNT